MSGYPATWQATALRNADAHWQGYPTYCARVTYATGALQGQQIGVTIYGAPCRVVVAPGLDWLTYCQTVMHETGHTRLGPRYFAASDPSDPAHSANPRAVMYALLGPHNMPPSCRRGPT